MMNEIKETCYVGTRILVGNEKRELINSMASILINQDFQEISIPIIQNQEIFRDKVGKENNNLMFNFKDRGNRDLCLAPEYTAVIQKLASTTYKYQKDVKLFYITECFRGEKPQAGRFRQFTQFGVEILNPTKNVIPYLKALAMDLLSLICRLNEFEINSDAVRGLDYYKDGMGFEISYPGFGSQKQVCGGGEYEGGAGFALGLDRLLPLLRLK